ncbi:lipopolysaccharide biosynthesis protein [Streptomyces wuyuanensis]|uniref:lipopolysaccharide biosynthesis protein n=1 Tax=Streptomyces wuyuanensis TaxID=1196353 RepID=UPI0034339861
MSCGVFRVVSQEGQTARIARNGARMLAARSAASVAGLVSLPFVYGRLGDRHYGVWVLLTGLVAVSALADLGLGSAQVREVARATAEDGGQRRACAVMTLGLVWGMVLGALSLALVVTGWPLVASACHLGDLAGPARNALVLLIVAFVADGLGAPWRSVLEGTQCYAQVARVFCGTSVLGAVLTASVAAVGGGLVDLAASTVVTSAVRSALFVRAARRRTTLLRPNLACVTRQDVAYVRGYGARVQVSNAAAAVNSESDRIVLAGFFGPSVTGAFDLGNRVVGLLRVASGAFLTVVFPVAAAAAREGTDALDRLYFTMTRWLAVFAAGGAVVLMVAADPLVRLWLGRPLPAAVTTIVILAPGFAVSIAGGAAAVVTRAEGQPGCETRSGVAAAVLNLLLSFPLLQALGPSGVPLATTVAASGATGYFFRRFHRRSGRRFGPLLQALWPPAAAACIAGVLVSTLASGLPDASGRLGAAAAVAGRSSLTLLVMAGILAGLGFFGGGHRAWPSVITRWLRSRQRGPATGHGST